MSFETFTKKKRRSFDPLASIWANGQFSINQATIDNYELGECSHVLLQYDREAARIGLKFLDTGLIEGAVKISHRDSGIVISARPFLDYYKINYGRSVRYGVTFEPAENRLVFDLSAAI